MKSDIELATQLIGENMVRETESQDRKERIVSQLKRQIKSSKEDRVKMSQTYKQVDEHRETFDVLLKLVNSSKFTEIKEQKKSSLKSIPEYLCIILKHYHKMKYQEANL